MSLNLGKAVNAQPNGGYVESHSTVGAAAPALNEPLGSPIPRFTYYEDTIKARDERIAAAKAAKLKAEQEAARVAAAKAEAARQAESARQAELVRLQQYAESIAKPVPVSPPATSGCVSGYSTGDYYLDKIMSYESGGNSCATNAGGCFGLLQACPGYPLRDACGGNPSCQIAWFQANKTSGRSWAQVWQHELDFGWW